jgi:excisionase family DNA binding protein
VPTPADRPAAAATTTDQYLDAKTAAIRLNLPLNTIYRMIGSGKLPALRFPVRIHGLATISIATPATS